MAGTIVTGLCRVGNTEIACPDTGPGSNVLSWPSQQNNSDFYDLLDVLNAPTAKPALAAGGSGTSGAGTGTTGSGAGAGSWLDSVANFFKSLWDKLKAAFSGLKYGWLLAVLVILVLVILVLGLLGVKLK